MPIQILLRHPVIVLAIAVITVAGCASSPDEPDDFVPPAIYAPPAPPFLSGPMSVFLTNTSGFTAHVTASGFGADPTKTLAGQLFGTVNKLLFAVEPGTSENDSKIGDPGFSFLWDVSAGRGHLLCEALQGHAPISSALGFIQIDQSMNSKPQLAGTRQATEENHSFRLSNNTTSVVQVLRLTDMQGFPLRLSSTSPTESVTVSLSRVHVQPQAPELFIVPEGFTPYSSAEALVDELAARRRELRRKAPIVNPLTVEE